MCSTAPIRDRRGRPARVTSGPWRRRKFDQLNQAATLQDLAVPPANRLEKLRGERAEQHSIRINDQYRMCFRWTEEGAEDVEIVDYH